LAERVKSGSIGKVSEVAPLQKRASAYKLSVPELNLALIRSN